MFEKIRAKLHALYAVLMLHAWMALKFAGKAGNFDAFMSNKRGNIDISELIMLGVAFYIIAYILPLGISAVINANTDGWDPTLITIWSILFPALGVFVVILYLVREVQKA